VRQLSREPSGNTPGPSRIEPSSEALRVSRRAVRQARLQSNHPPKRRERAIRQYAGPVSIRTIRRSAASEPSGNTPGSSPSEPSAEAPRASHRAIRRARLHPNHPPKRRERAVGQCAGPVSNRTIRRSAASEPSGNTPGPSPSEPSAEAPRASHQAIRRARLDSNHPPKRYTSEPSGKPPGPPRTIRRARLEPSAEGIHKRSVEQAVAAEPCAIRRSSRSQRAPQISNRTP